MSDSSSLPTNSIYPPITNDALWTQAMASSHLALAQTSNTTPDIIVKAIQTAILHIQLRDSQALPITQSALQAVQLSLPTQPVSPEIITYLNQAVTALTPPATSSFSNKEHCISGWSWCSILKLILLFIVFILLGLLACKINNGDKGFEKIIMNKL